MSHFLLKGYHVFLQSFRYVETNQICLEAFEVETNERVFRLTVNLIDELIPDGYVVIKNYAENSGILQELIKAGVVEEPYKTIQTGFTEVYVCKLLIEL